MGLPKDPRSAGAGIFCRSRTQVRTDVRRADASNLPDRPLTRTASGGSIGAVLYEEATMFMVDHGIAAATARHAKTLLALDPRFRHVSHARRPSASEPVPNILSFHYQETQFFLEAHRDGKARLRVAKGDQYGIGPLLDAFDPALCDAVADVLEEHVDAKVVVNRYGEALIIRDATVAARPRLSLAHSLCGGTVDRHLVSGSHAALACRKCNLRIVVPASVVTPDELRAHFAALLNEH